MTTAESTAITYKSHLHEMTQTTPTVLWNDSATLKELEYAIEHGGVGATCNPVIVLDALKKESAIWNDRVRQLAAENPTATEDEIGWLLIEDVCRTRAKLLEKAFEEHKGRNGRLYVPRAGRRLRAICTTGPLHLRKPGPGCIPHHFEQLLST